MLIQPGQSNHSTSFTTKSNLLGTSCSKRKANFAFLRGVGTRREGYVKQPTLAQPSSSQGAGAGPGGTADAFKSKGLGSALVGEGGRIVRLCVWLLASARLARSALPWSGRSQRRSRLNAHPVAAGTGFRPSVIQSGGPVPWARRGVELLRGCSSRRAGLWAPGRRPRFLLPFALYAQLLQVTLCGRASAPSAASLPPAPPRLLLFAHLPLSFS